MVGAGVCKKPPIATVSTNNKINQGEFIWHAEDNISLVAVLRNYTASLLQGLHQTLFRAEKQIGLVLFGKGILAHVG